MTKQFTLLLFIGLAWGQSVCQYDGQSLADTYETKWEKGGEFRKFKCKSATCGRFYWIPTGLRNKPLPNNIYSNPNSGSNAVDQVIGQFESLTRNLSSNSYSSGSNYVFNPKDLTSWWSTNGKLTTASFIPYDDPPYSITI